MTTTLLWLAATALLTTLMWIPYGLNRMQVQGMLGAMGNREKDNPPLAAWAYRAQRAHTNAMENLVVFATLVLVAHVAGVADVVTLWAAGVYFWARLLHYIVYAAGIIGLRTAIWAVGWVCHLVVAWQVLAAG